jgi:hypothetical protein
VGQAPHGPGAGRDGVDADWLDNTAGLISRLVPGQVKVFESDEVNEAKAWLVGITLDDD